MSYNKSSSIVGKIQIFLASLCGKTNLDQQKNQTNGQFRKRKLSTTMRKHRNSFLLEETLIKLSRKNILEQQFMTGQILTLRVEQHLAKRVNECTIGALKGDFLPYIYRSLISPIVIRDNLFHTDLMDPDSDAIIGKVSEVLFLRNLDVLLVQLYYGETNQNELANMQNILLNNFETVESIIFICGKDVTIKQYSKLFKIYAQIYMCQIQRVMLMQQLQFNIIYFSKNPHFLRIKDQCIEDYIIEFCQIDSLSLEIQQKSKELLKKLMQKHLYTEICKYFAQTANDPKKIAKLELFPHFVKLIYDCCEPARKIIESHYKQDAFFDNMTPCFGRMSNSTQF